MLKRRVERRSSSPSCSVWWPKRRRLKRFLRPPSLGSTNTSSLTVNAGEAVVMSCLMTFDFSPRRIWRTVWKHRGVKKTPRWRRSASSRG